MPHKPQLHCVLATNKISLNNLNLTIKLLKLIILTYDYHVTLRSPPTVPLTSFRAERFSSGSHTLYFVFLFLVSLKLEQFLSLSLSLTILIHLEITGQLFRRLCFNLGFSDVSSWLNLSYTSLVRKSQKWHWVLLTEFSKVSHSSDLSITDNIILTTWLRWLLPVFSNIQLLFFPYTVLLYFDAQIVLVLASRSLCTLASVSCWHVPIILQLLPYFLHPQDAPGSSWLFPVLPMESTVLLESGFLVWLLNRWAS